VHILWSETWLWKRSSFRSLHLFRKRAWI